MKHPLIPAGNILILMLCNGSLLNAAVFAGSVVGNSIRNSPALQQ
jgi:hypothetical protein